jgi:hypothetical protein
MSMTIEGVRAVPVAAYEDKEAWLAARRPGVTATEAAKLARSGAGFRATLLREKLSGVESFRGNVYTRHGKEREPILAAWAEAKHKLRTNSWLYAHPDNPRHLATPDAISSQFDFDEALGEIKTTNKPFPKVPPLYYDQMQWQAYVMGAAGVWFIWEQHVDFQPVGIEPVSVWVRRDQARIDELVKVVDEFLLMLDGEAPIDPEIDEWGAEYTAAQQEEKQAAARKKAAGEQLRLRIGDRPELKQAGLYANVTFTTSPVVEEEVEVVTFDVDTFRVTHPRLFKRFGKVTTETRRSGGNSTLRVTVPKLVQVAVEDGELVEVEGADAGLGTNEGN